MATLLGTGRLGTTLTGGWAELAGPGFIALILAAVVCEQIWPAQPRRILATGHIQGACFFLVYANCVVPIMTLLGVAFAALLNTHAGWIDAPWTSSWPLWLVVPPTLIAMDGANWLAHWADHRVTALWRFHALHHSQEESNVLTSFRAHPLVHTTGFFLATIPVLFLMGDRSVAPPSSLSTFVWEPCRTPTWSGRSARSARCSLAPRTTGSTTPSAHPMAPISASS